jgi:hypothetical protein
MEWRNVFFISCGFLVATNVVYLIWGSGEKQPFDNPVRKERKNSFPTENANKYNMRPIEEY